MYKLLVLTLLFCATASRCSKSRTYLTDEEKGWNPYKKGQTIIFKSEGLLDSIFIEDVLYKFPDGIGAMKYEFACVYARHHDPRENNAYSNTYILDIEAKYEKQPSSVEFSLKAKSSLFFNKRYTFTELKELQEIELSVPYKLFNDVIVIKSQGDYSDNEFAIKTIYWSKSTGYIRFDKYDGTRWELVDIIEP